MAINLFGNPNMKPTTGKTTMPAQPSIQPAMKPAPSPLTGTGTPWQRGTRGMDRVKMPGVNSYAPQRPATPPVTGVQSLSRPAQPTTWGGANDPRLNSANNAAYNSGMNSGANGVQQGSWGGANDPRLNPANNAAYKAGMNSGANGGQQPSVQEGGGVRSMEFRDENRNGIEDRDEPGYGTAGWSGYQLPPPVQPQGSLFGNPRVQGNMPQGFGGVAPTGDTSTWDANDWFRYNQFQQQQQNPLAAALSNYGG